MTYIKAKDWDGKDLKGPWECTLKIDGVRALWNTNLTRWESRADKPLYNIPPVDTMWKEGFPTDIEVYIHDRAPDQKQCFKDTIRATRSRTLKTEDGCTRKQCKCRSEFAHLDMVHRDTCKNWEIATPIIKPEHMYSLDPLDPRLCASRFMTTSTGAMGSLITDPNAATIRWLMAQVVDAGYEGLVLRGTGPDGLPVWYKVKPKPTWDVLILEVIEGKGKRKGHVGAFMTSKGKVGGFRGFSYAALKALWEGHDTAEPNDTTYLIGQTIEVEAMGLTPSGMFRQPRCIRFRPDKVATE